MLYVSMDGARQTLMAQAANSNNLANVSTVGFQGDIAAFSPWEVQGPGHATRVHAIVEETDYDATPGRIAATGRDLDVAIVGAGWIAVQSQSGEEAYSRAGDFRIAPSGLLENGKGQLILGDGGPITVPPAAKIEISTSGILSILPAGGASQNLITVDRIKLVNPDPATMAKGSDGLMRPRDGSLLAADASVALATRSLEQSNVNAVEAMVNMIQLSRLFETQVRMMSVADENSAATSALLRMRG